MLAGLLVGNDDWGVRSNREAGEGFADLIVEMDDPDVGAVIEIKCAQNFADLDRACQKAMDQVYDRRYAEYLQNEGREDIWAYGIAFYKKRCRVLAKKL